MTVTMRYLVNVDGRMVHVPDLNKMIPFEAGNYTVWEVDEETFQKSMDLKKLIAAKMIVDVTAEVLALKAHQGEGAPQSVDPVVNTDSIATSGAASLPPSPEGMPAPTLIRRPHASIMVDEYDSSRALSGADAASHLQNAASRLRPGVDSADSGIIVDAHTTKEAAILAEESRTSYIVEEESRAQPRVDPRFSANPPVIQAPFSAAAHLPPSPPVSAPTLSDDTIKLNSVLIDRIATAAAESQIRKQQTASALSNDRIHQHHNYDPNWWQNSTFARERMADQMQHKAQVMHHRANPIAEVDERILANKTYLDSAPNPILADIMSGGSESAPQKTFLDEVVSEVKEETSVDVSPLASLLAEADASESKPPKGSKRSTRGKKSK